MVLHDLAHALTYSHRIAVMEKGCLLAVQQPEELFKSGLLQRRFWCRGPLGGGRKKHTISRRIISEKKLKSFWDSSFFIAPV